MIRNRTEARRKQVGKKAPTTKRLKLRNGSRARAIGSLRSAFREQFPHDTVDVSDGYMDNIHIVVVSRRFDGLGEQQKQDFMWEIIDSTSLKDEQKTLISLLLPLSPGQLK